MLLQLPVIPQVQPPVIQLIIKQEKKDPEPQKIEPPEPTLEEKIATNFYKCNTDLQYIRADNAQCIDKSTYIPQNAVRSPENISGSVFPYGWCTYEAHLLRPDLNVTGNAADWIKWSNGTTPKIGAIAVNTWVAAGLGHVAYVLEIGDGEILVRHMNYHGFGVVSDDWLPLSYFQGYIY